MLIDLDESSLFLVAKKSGNIIIKIKIERLNKKRVSFFLSLGFFNEATRNLRDIIISLYLLMNSYC